MLDVQFEESSLTNGFEDIRLHIFSMATEREREYERSEEKCVYVKFREVFFYFISLVVDEARNMINVIVKLFVLRRKKNLKDDLRNF